METASHPIGPERQMLGAGAGWLQLATYPQSPFSGPVRCCDVTDLSQAFSQRTVPGAIMDKSGRHFVATNRTSRAGREPTYSQKQINLIKALSTLERRAPVLALGY